jgi:hypothetical protein
MAIQMAQVSAERTWLQTLHEWVTTVDHKRLGVLYLRCFFSPLPGRKP